MRSERALTLALAEMYVQGVSTRKVTKVIEELCGCEVTSTQMSWDGRSLFPGSGEAHKATDG